MKSIHFNILLILVSAVILVNCKPKEEPKVLGSIYGTIIDKNTSNPIHAASVELNDLGIKTITGSDGKFEFSQVEEGTYHLFITKSGYKEYETNDILLKGNADKKQVDVQLEPLPPSLTIVDDNGYNIDTIDFGDKEDDVMRSFNLFNNSDESIEWNIFYNSDWVASFNKSEGHLKAGETQTIVVVIDRNKLVGGKNSTMVHIVSDNGSKQLIMHATRCNILETTGVTDISAFSAVLHANLIRDMQPTIIENGFVYSKLPAPSLANGAHSVTKKGTLEIGEYSMRIENLERDQKYFFCAYVTNGEDIIYGGQLEFTTISHTPQIEISRVSTAGSTITVTYNVSDAGIPLQEVGLCWDTDVLPTKDMNYKKYGDEAKSYTSTITDVSPNTLYYIRAYAQNEEGIEYSKEMHINTTDGLPNVTTSEFYSKGTTYLIVKGSATSDSSLPITSKGFCWSAEHDPSINDNIVMPANISENPFECRIDNLQPGTTYYIRAFAINNNGPGYGSKREFVTDYEPAILMGYVYDQNSVPLQGVIVEEYDSYRFSTTTDANGYFEISVLLRRNETYTIRAYKENYNEQIKSITLPSGKTTQQDFILNSNTPSIPETGSIYTMPDGSFMVQTVDLGSAQWNSAKSLCESSTLGGYTDWRLPTLDELNKIYNNKNQIGGFPSRAVNDNNYWTNTPGSRTGYYCYVNFNDGTSGNVPRVNNYKVRAVRTIN